MSKGHGLRFKGLGFRILGPPDHEWESIGFIEASTKLAYLEVCTLLPQLFLGLRVQVGWAGIEIPSIPLHNPYSSPLTESVHSAYGYLPRFLVGWEFRRCSMALLG